MPDIGTPWAFLFEHPIIGVIVFAAVSAGAILVLSGGQLVDALGGLLRIFITIFTTPFKFLRDAIDRVRNAREAEQDYEKSSVFLLFRANRIWYGIIFVLCLLILSGGITTAVLSLYPGGEMQQVELLDEQIEQIETELATARNEAIVPAEAAPNNAAQLEQARTTARNAYQNQVNSNAEFINGLAVRGPFIDRLANAYNEDTVEYVRANLDQEINTCLRRRGSNAATCAQYRTAVVELADRKDNEFRLARAAQEAENAWRQGDQAARRAAQQAEYQAARVTEVEQRLQYAREQRASVNPWDPKRLSERLVAAVLMVLATLWSVIVFVWIAAIAIDVWNWVILMMRSLERTQQAKLVSFRDSEPEAS
jgi:hypothetical protein